MMSSQTKRRALLGIGLAALGLVLSVVLAREALTGAAIGYLLRKAGASEITYNVTRASPWHVGVEDVAFLLRARGFSAKRVSMDRCHWWSASLGKVRMEQVKVPLAVGPVGAQPAPVAGATERGAPAAVNLPLEELSVDGQLILQVGELPDQALAMKLSARQGADRRWEAQVQVDGPGLGMSANGTYAADVQQLDFTVSALTLDVKTWQNFVRAVAPVPALDGWELEGRLSGHGAGKLADGKLSMGGSLQWREGRLSNAAQAVTAEGVEADVEFLDFGRLRTKPGSLRVRTLTTKVLPLENIAADFSLVGADRIEVTHATLTALGGTVSTEPFTYVPSAGEIEAVVLVDGISVEQVMALTKDLPAEATGRVNGRFPITFGASGLHFGTGWLGLAPGVNAEVAFRAAGLLTAGASPKSPSYSVLQRIESGLLKLRISELRLDLQPAGAPAGRSATLHLKGAPVDPTVKAPVILDLNVNGPLEKLLKMGLDSRLSVGAKP